MRLKQQILPAILAFALLLPVSSQAFHGFGAAKDRIEGKGYYFFIRGYLSFKTGELDRALDFLTKALDYESGDPVLFTELANVYIKKGKFEIARNYLEKALKLGPDNRRAMELLAGIYSTTDEKKKSIKLYRKLITKYGDNDSYLQLSSLYAEGGNFKDAEKTVRELIGKKPRFFLGYFYLGRILAAQKKFEKALTNYRKSIEMHPSFDSAMVDAAWILDHQGKTAEATKMYEKAIEINPANAVVRDRLGQLYIQKQEYGKAAGQYEALKSFDVNNTALRTKLGLIYFESRNLERAIEEFNFVLGKKPDNHRVRVFLGSAYQEKGMIKPAKEAFLKVPPQSEYFRDAMFHLAFLYSKDKNTRGAIGMLGKLEKKYPNDVGVKVFLGELLYDGKQFEKAEKVLLKVITLAPENERAHFLLGVVYDKLGSFELLEKQMKKAIEINPQDGTALNYLAYSYADRNVKLVEAEAMVKQAIKMKPEDGYYIDSLAWVYFRQGRIKDALGELEKALEVVPNDPVILEHMGDVLRALSRKKEAALYYRKALEKHHDNPELVQSKLKEIEK